MQLTFAVVVIVLLTSLITLQHYGLP